MSTIAAPEKELRFTRSRQAVPFWLLGAVCAATALTLVLTATKRDINPLLPHPLWALIPFLAALLSWRLAWRLTRHAYLILSPLGVEIFPFFRPSRTMSLVSWQEIASAEVSEDLTRLTLHHNPEKTSGVHLSLRPIFPHLRPLLARAVTLRVAPAPQLQTPGSLDKLRLESPAVFGCNPPT
jgi:hypothetical protein